VPDPHDLFSVPAEPSKVAGDAVVGIVAPHFRYQLGGKLTILSCGGTASF
jgi:hypothetical protein